MLRTFLLSGQKRKKIFGMAPSASKHQKRTSRVVIRPVECGEAQGQRGIPGTIEYPGGDGAVNGLERSCGAEGSSAAFAIEEVLVCIFCDREAPSFAKLSHHVGYVHQVSYRDWCNVVERKQQVLRRSVKSEGEDAMLEPVLTPVPRIPRGRTLCDCHPHAGGAKPHDVYGQLASGRRYIYHDLDGISYLRKTTSRQVQWGSVPRVVFEVRTPGERPLYLIGDRWGGHYTHDLPENLTLPRHVVDL